MGRMGKRGRRPGGYLDEDGYNDKQMQSQDRDERYASERGGRGGRGAGPSGRGGGTAGQGSRGPQVELNRHVPKFLQNHTKWLRGEKDHLELVEAAEQHTAKRAREGSPEDASDAEMRERHEALERSAEEAPELREHVLAEIAKEKGNRAFQKKRYEEALGRFSTAIDKEPLNEALWSNRSAVHCAMRKFEEALKDAKKCVSLKPDWPKGHHRMAAALMGLEDYDRAADSYGRVLELEPDNEQAKTGLDKAERALARQAEGGVAFKRKEDRVHQGPKKPGSKGGGGEGPGLTLPAAVAVRNDRLLSFNDED